MDQITASRSWSGAKGPSFHLGLVFSEQKSCSLRISAGSSVVGCTQLFGKPGVLGPVEASAQGLSRHLSGLVPPFSALGPTHGCWLLPTVVMVTFPGASCCPTCGVSCSSIAVPSMPISPGFGAASRKSTFLLTGLRLAGFESHFFLSPIWEQRSDSESCYSDTAASPFMF